MFLIDYYSCLIQYINTLNTDNIIEIILKICDKQYTYYLVKLLHENISIELLNQFLKDNTDINDKMKKIIEKFSNNLDDEIDDILEECGICCGIIMENDEILQCNVCKNFMHLECFTDWVNVSNYNAICPYCRSVIDLNNILIGTIINVVNNDTQVGITNILSLPQQTQHKFISKGTLYYHIKERINKNDPCGMPSIPNNNCYYKISSFMDKNISSNKIKHATNSFHDNINDFKTIHKDIYEKVTHDHNYIKSLLDFNKNNDKRRDKFKKKDNDNISNSNGSNNS